MTDLTYKYFLQACDIVIVFKKSSKLLRVINKLFCDVVCHYKKHDICLFLFDELCADTTSSGIRNRSLFPYDPRTTTIFVVRYRDLESHQRNIIIESALQFATERHSFITGKTVRNNISCLQFITQCFYNAGIILFPGKDGKDITIDDFLDCTLLDKIIVNECK